MTILKFTKLKTLILLAAFCSAVSAYAKTGPYYYQLKVYHFQTNAQQAVIDNYLQQAYLPALHRAGIPAVGVFKPIAQDTTDKVIFVFVPFKTIADFLELSDVLNKDQVYLQAGSAYLNAAYNEAPYTRLETILLRAFKGMPTPHKPVLTGPVNQRVYELRSYESPTEMLGENKIGMFNDREMSIFNKLNFNAVFYGQVLSGSRMPNLMYLTTFNNKADRDKHWKDFGVDYKPISEMPQYQHNINKNVTLFLYPAAYSDF